jgi:hypothetical protein
LGTRVVACASSTGSFVGIASWAEVNQAVGSLAVIFRSSAVSLFPVSNCMYRRLKTNIRHQSSSTL